MPPGGAGTPGWAGWADLSGRGIGISGGGGHLGGALALGLAGAGALVVICGRGPERLRTVAERARELKLPGRIFDEPADLRVPADLERVLDRVEREAGALHGWVNNAYGGPSEPLGALTREGTLGALSSGVADLMHATERAAGRMRPGDDGAIVNVSSMYGLVSPQPAAYAKSPRYHNPPAYGAAKAGVIQFTRYAACHYAPRGIRVNCVSPGPFPRDEVREDGPFVEELRQRVPLGRVGEAEELVGPVAFLLSRGASFVTGHNLVVDGGWTAW